VLVPWSPLSPLPPSLPPPLSPPLSPGPPLLDARPDVGKGLEDVEAGNDVPARPVAVAFAVAVAPDDVDGAQRRSSEEPAGRRRANIIRRGPRVWWVCVRKRAAPRGLMDILGGCRPANDTWCFFMAELAKNGSAGRVRKIPPGEPARSTVPRRVRASVSPAAATAPSFHALISVHLCYIALCANSRLFRFLSY